MTVKERLKAKVPTRKDHPPASGHTSTAVLLIDGMNVRNEIRFIVVVVVVVVVGIRSLDAYQHMLSGSFPD